MFRLEELAKKDSAFINEVGELLEASPIKGLRDNELAVAAEILLQFPTIIQNISTHPEYNLKGLDMFSYYYAVKGNVTDNLRVSQRKRIERIGILSRNYTKVHPRLANKIHKKKIETIFSFKDVKTHFDQLDIYDGRSFSKVLDGMTPVFQCPEIIPKNAKEAFGGRWYNVKHFHTDYKFGIKNVDELKEDGRKNMFFEGVFLLKNYLSRK